ncbi:hypothetical protein K491DRAFT_603413 [Lophiostoma macrostomum CBS 122681]|uniref:F-box domain-containing protein n=1 Tax=Lophiostoma macrostomum CBS 122681 TaxID=1314788 RepID=A0A6A6T0A6_9PLEO|nr:hypothetical protein K491DRAFT_603413 [Lophiostoma macrostomum CBS 122681]
MSLLGLPPEIVDELLNLSLPHSIQHFSMSCKAVYARAAPQLRRHKALGQKWKRALLLASDHGNPLRMLYEISQDPLVPQYIEALDLREWPSTAARAMPAEMDSNTFRTDAKAMDAIKDLVTDSIVLQNAGLDPDEWWEMMMNEDVVDEMAVQSEEVYTPYTIVMLLTQLPNLKSLQLPPGWAGFRPFDDAAMRSGEDDKRIMTLLDALVAQSYRTGAPLGQLKSVLPFMSEGYEERAGLQAIQAFLPLKSMRSLFLVSCLAVDDNYTGIPFEWRYPTMTTSLRRVELAFCCMDADGISVLLARTPLLQVFKYSHQTKWHGCEHDWNPGAFTEAVARHVGPSLTDFALTIDDLYGDVINGASSVLSFSNLKRLEVDVRVFCGPPIESGQKRGMNAFVPQGDRAWTVEDIPCIGSMLPPSIVAVEINTDFPNPDHVALEALLKNVKEQRAERLKSLETVVIRQYDAESARDMVERAGITLAIYDELGEDRPRSMMPSWKREFARRVGGIRWGL